MNGSAMNGGSTMRSGGGVGSKLMKMQASFQAKQQEEKEYKLVNLMEERQMHNFVIDSISRNKGIGLSRSSSQLSRSPARNIQSVQENRSQMKNSVMGWDKSYPLRPVLNSSPPKPNKYSGNYGINQVGARNTMSLRRRGMSLERNAAQSQQDLVAPFSKMLRTQSQNYLSSHQHQPAAANGQQSGAGFLASSSEDSYTSSRPHSGLDVHKDLTDSCHNYPSSDDSPKIISPRYKSVERDYTKPLPPTYRKNYANSTQNLTTYTDSAYSSHSSDRSDIQVEKYVYTRRRPPVPPVQLQQQQQINNNDLMYRSSDNLKSQTFKKQKSPVRKETLPYRSYENSDEEDSDVQFRAKKSERQREEDRRRMQYEMRKREQELLAKIKDQQRELETIRIEKSEVEKQLYIKKRDVIKVDSFREPKGENFREPREQQRENIRGSREQLYQRDSREEHREPLREQREPHREPQRTPLREQQREMLRREASRETLKREPSREPQRTPQREPQRTPQREPLREQQTLRREPSRERRILNREQAKPALLKKEPVAVRSHPSPKVPKKTPSKKPPTPSDSPQKQTRRSVFNPKARNDLAGCKMCGRNFAEDRIEKHEEVCAKTHNKKRKAFDMTKARVKGTDAAKYVIKGAKQNVQSKSNSKTTPPKSDWRRKREEFINTLRAAKQAQLFLKNGGNIRDLPPPPPSDTSHYIPCPYCNRRFAEAVADRHIPKCKDIKSNKR